MSEWTSTLEPTDCEGETCIEIVKGPLAPPWQSGRYPRLLVYPASVYVRGENLGELEALERDNVIALASEILEKLNQE